MQSNLAAAYCVVVVLARCSLNEPTHWLFLQPFSNTSRMLEIVLAVPAALRLPLFRVSEFVLTGPVRFLNELSFLAVPAALRFL